MSSSNEDSLPATLLRWAGLILVGIGCLFVFFFIVLVEKDTSEKL